MEDLNITSEPAKSPANSTPTKKRRKRRTAAQIARDKRKSLQVRDALEEHPVKVEEPKNDSLSKIKERAPEPVGPSPAVLALQSQVVELVNQRNSSRQRLTQAHTAYLMAQGSFQAMQSELQGIEQEVQYRIQLIAQLENRTPQSPILQFPPSETPYASVGTPSTLQGVSSEPSAPVQRPVGSNLQYATGSADDLRREIRGMM